MSNEKQKIFLYDDPAYDWVIGGDIESLLMHLRAYYEEMEDGEELTLSVRRKDMTQAEIDAAPVI